jgi:hypothetical protein
MRPDASNEDQLTLDFSAPLPAGVFVGLERAEENADAWWWSTAMTAIKHLASTGVEFSAYEITILGVPDPDNSARWGALFNAASKAGLIEAVGYQRSQRPGRSGGSCRTWRGRQPVAA